MKQKDNSGTKGNDNSATKHKGESQPTAQKGSISVSKKGKGKHTKDESHGADKLTTKKQGNSI